MYDCFAISLNDNWEMIEARPKPFETIWQSIDPASECCHPLHNYFHRKLSRNVLEPTRSNITRPLMNQIARRGITAWVENSCHQPYPVHSTRDEEDGRIVRIFVDIPESARKKKLRVVFLRWKFSSEEGVNNCDSYCAVRGVSFADDTLDGYEDKSVFRIMYKQDEKPNDCAPVAAPEMVPSVGRWRLRAKPKVAGSDVLAILRLEVRSLSKEVPTEIRDTLQRDERVSLPPHALDTIGDKAEPTVIFEFVFRVMKSETSSRSRTTASKKREVDILPPDELVADQPRKRASTRKRQSKQSQRYYEMESDTEEYYSGAPSKRRKRESRVRVSGKRYTPGPSEESPAAVSTNAITQEVGSSDVVDGIMKLMEEEQELRNRMGHLYAAKKATVDKLREAAHKLGI